MNDAGLNRANNKNGKGGVTTLTTALTSAIRTRLEKKDYFLEVYDGAYVSVSTNFKDKKKLNFTYFLVSRLDDLPYSSNDVIEVKGLLKGLNHVIAHCEDGVHSSFANKPFRPERKMMFLVVEGKIIIDLANNVDEVMSYMTSTTEAHDEEKSFSMNLLQESLFETYMLEAYTRLQFSLRPLLLKEVITFDGLMLALDVLNGQSNRVLSYCRIQDSDGIHEEFDREKDLELSESNFTTLVALKRLSSWIRVAAIGHHNLTNERELIDFYDEVYELLDLQDEERDEDY